MSAFDKAIAYTAPDEGGWADVKGDRGGATKYGVTRATLSRWRGRPCSRADVQNLSMQEAKEIFKAWYWDPMDLDQIRHANVAICMYNIGVVRGIGVPPKYAQKICNILGQPCVVDGHIGPKTIAAINACNPSAFIEHFSSMAESGFRSIIASNPSQAKFLNGWVRRARRLKTLKLYV